MASVCNFACRLLTTALSREPSARSLIFSRPCSHCGAAKSLSCPLKSSGAPSIRAARSRAAGRSGNQAARACNCKRRMASWLLICGSCSLIRPCVNDNRSMPSPQGLSSAAGVLLAACGNNRPPTRKPLGDVLTPIRQPSALNSLSKKCLLNKAPQATFITRLSREKVVSPATVIRTPKSARRPVKGLKSTLATSTCSAPCCNDQDRKAYCRA